MKYRRNIKATYLGMDLHANSTYFKKILHGVHGRTDCGRRIVGLSRMRHAAVPGDAADTRVIWYTHPRAKPIFTDGLRVPAGYTESVILTFPS